MSACGDCAFYRREADCTKDIGSCLVGPRPARAAGFGPACSARSHGGAWYRERHRGPGAPPRAIDCAHFAAGIAEYGCLACTKMPGSSIHGAGGCQRQWPPCNDFERRTAPLDGNLCRDCQSYVGTDKMGGFCRRGTVCIVAAASDPACGAWVALLARRAELGTVTVEVEQ